MSPPIENMWPFFLSRRFVAASGIVALAYLGETLYGPVVGNIAREFGHPETVAYTFISAAFYGSALSGLLILLFVQDCRLERWLASALIVGAVVNLLSLNAATWSAALLLRVVAGICFGIAVGGVVILLAQSASGVRLVRQLSVMFSFVFLSIAVVTPAVPILVERLGNEGLTAIHLALCSLAAVALPVRFHGRVAIRACPSIRIVWSAVPRTFWCRRKTLAFSLHATSLFAALLVLIGMQPALFEKGATETEIALFLSTLSAATFLGGILHSWLAHRFGLLQARWALLLSETAALGIAAVLMAGDRDSGVFLAVLVLATKGIFGGPPTFEAMLYDLGPIDAAASGLQRSLSMIAAIAATNLVLAFATWMQMDILLAIIVALALAYVWQLAAFAELSRGLMPRYGGLGKDSATLPEQP